jgi:hypothetical protein
MEKGKPSRKEAERTKILPSFVRIWGDPRWHIGVIVFPKGNELSE